MIRAIPKKWKEKKNKSLSFIIRLIPVVLIVNVFLLCVVIQRHEERFGSNLYHRSIVSLAPAIVSIFSIHNRINASTATKRRSCGFNPPPPNRLYIGLIIYKCNEKIYLRICSCVVSLTEQKRIERSIHSVTIDSRY